MSTCDTQLADQAARGDEAAFRRLLERHYDAVFRIARRNCGSAEDAEDITQEVCVSLPRKLASFKGQSKFTTWLYRVVVNCTRDHLRRVRSSDQAMHQYAEVASLSRHEADDTAARIAWLYNALGQLDDTLQETAVLVVGEELNHAETGEILGVSESTISWRMHKIRQKLQEIADNEQ